MLALTWSSPEGVSVISTFWGNPAAVNDPIRAAGALHVHTVGSVAEACLTASADF
jgi:NAD(P)H-dependent flavin oxidoreductase YrpB (nitropropane dioxygenase family)